jgi:hypothetical protein
MTTKQHGMFMDEIESTVKTKESTMNLANPPANNDSSRLTVAPAANNDRLQGNLPDGQFETTSGWDSYEVWRRFIKEARDRRDRNPS